MAWIKEHWYFCNVDCSEKVLDVDLLLVEVLRDVLSDRFDESFVKGAIWEEKGQSLLKEVEEDVVFEVLSDEWDDKFDYSHGGLRLKLVEQVSISRYVFNGPINGLQYFFLT